jgi:choline dehydrogenase
MALVSSESAPVFDYIIVGAGAAGCLLAERLTADGKSCVALLEAGGSDRTPNVMIPAAFSKLFNTERDWAFRTEPEPALLGRQLFWPRGKMLGGSSSINAMMYIRGNRLDFERWGELAGSHWSFEVARQTFARFEKNLHAPADIYGREGAQVIEQQREPNVITHAFLEACAAEGIRTLRDLSEFDNDGCALTSVTQKRGLRFSAADAFLRPALARKNLTLIKHARVDRLEFDGRRVVGVSGEQKDGEALSLRARREVISCGGAIGSAQLLLQSGIGPSDELAALGITPRVDLRGVGHNLQDHALVGIIHACPHPITMFVAESLKNLIKLATLRRGMLTSNVAEAVAFVRSGPEQPAPDLELISAPTVYQDHGAVAPTGHGMSLAALLLTPESRGRISLSSKDPGAPPRIEPRYLTDPAGSDLKRLTLGVRRVQRLLKTAPLSKYVGDIIESPGDDASDEQIATFIREQLETLYHPVGTCRMGSDEDSVVDPSLRVRGVEGLRVADASVMPTITRGHTYAPTLLIAERAADILRGL